MTLPSPGLAISTKNCSSTPDEADEMKNIPFCKALGLLM